MKAILLSALAPLRETSSATLRLCAILLAANSHAEEPLAWKWAPGDEARYLVTQTVDIQIDAGASGQVINQSRQELTVRWTVDSDEGGAARLTQTTERVVLKNEGVAGQDFAYDSASEEPPMGMAALVAPMYRAMVDHPYRFTMKPTGEVSDVVFAKELSTALDNLPGGMASGEIVVQMAKCLTPRFPTNAPEIGKGWTVESDFSSVPTGPLQLLTDCSPGGDKEVEGRRLEVVSITSRFAPEVEGKTPETLVEMKESTGEVLFDREKGRLLRSTVNQTMAVRSPNGAEGVTNEVVQTIEWRALDSEEEAATAE